MPLLRGLNSADLNSREVEIVNRAVNRLGDKADIRVAYLASHTIDMLPKYVCASCAIDGVKASAYVGGFSQYYQEVLDPESDLHGYNPDIIFLSVSIGSLSAKIHKDFSWLSDEQKAEERERILAHLLDWVSAAKKATDAVLLVSNLQVPVYPGAGIADYTLSSGETEWDTELNLALLKALRNDTRAYLFDLENVISRYGKLAAFNAQMYYLARAEWDEGFLPTVAEELVRFIKASRGLAKKCLVVDLDNTLWGGVVGEEGALGVKVGQGFAEGELFYDFQNRIRSLKQRGVVLAIASKNNPEDAEEVFAKRDDMPLKLKDFTVRKINWEHKYKNILQIAETLNIGVDSLVFLDDNPVERGYLGELLPEVSIIDLPQDPVGYSEALMRSMCFEKLSITAEDISKTGQYEQNAVRNEVRQKSGSIESYLESLGTRVTIASASARDIERAHQLFSKTNQFNLTTKRYSIAEVENFMAGDAWQLKLVSVQDNFGNLGIVGLYLVELRENTAFIDSFILSCRAMGRGIETAMMNQIKHEYLTVSGLARLEALYIATQKNKPAAAFYGEQGFSELAGDADASGEVRYNLINEDVRRQECPGIQVDIV